METSKTYTISCESTFGNAKFSIVRPNTTLDELIQAAGKGMLQEVQRVAASRAEKAIVGYKKRPKGFERSSIQFSADMAETLEMFLRENHKGIDLSEAEITVVEYVPTAAEKKFVAAKKAINTAIRDGKLEKLAAYCDFDFTDIDELNDENEEFVNAVDASL